MEFIFQNFNQITYLVSLLSIGGKNRGIQSSIPLVDEFIHDITFAV